MGQDFGRLRQKALDHRRAPGRLSVLGLHILDTVFDRLRLTLELRGKVAHHIDLAETGKLIVILPIPGMGAQLENALARQVARIRARARPADR